MRSSQEWGCQWKASVMSSLPPPPRPQLPVIDAGQPRGVVASGSLWTVDEAVSAPVPSSVASLSCGDVPGKWCPPAARSESTVAGLSLGACAGSTSGARAPASGTPSARPPLPHLLFTASGKTVIICHSLKSHRVLTHLQFELEEHSEIV